MNEDDRLAPGRVGAFDLLTFLLGDHPGSVVGA